jgi:hypothetical protein
MLTSYGKKALTGFEPLVTCVQFIERTGLNGGGRKKAVVQREIIPGDWGKVGSGWLVRPLSTEGRKA